MPVPAPAQATCPWNEIPELAALAARLRADGLGVQQLFVRFERVTRLGPGPRTATSAAQQLAAVVALGSRPQAPAQLVLLRPQSAAALQHTLSALGVRYVDNVPRE